jgi:hypothetical protein
MMPDYDAMSQSELRHYILTHREDVAAIEAFFARRSPDDQATWYAPPTTPAEWQQQMEMIQPILEADRQRTQQHNPES